jgi:hypothetical protein
LGDEPSPRYGIAVWFGSLDRGFEIRSRKSIAYAATSIGVGILLRLFGPQTSPDGDIFRMLLIFRSSAIRDLFMVGVLYFIGVLCFIGGVMPLFLYMQHTSERIRSLAELDRLVHEPGRLAIVLLRSAVKEADFLCLLNDTGPAKANLSSHLSKLEASGYVDIDKLIAERSH